MRCERCGKSAKGFELFDYCALCSKNLCPSCMAKGHCGQTPARSGMEADDGNQERDKGGG